MYVHYMCYKRPEKTHVFLLTEFILGELGFVILFNLFIFLIYYSKYESSKKKQVPGLVVHVCNPKTQEAEVL
jgi:hypothetical protein